MRVTQEDLVKEIRNSNRWCIRFHVAKTLAEYFHTLCHVGGGPINIKKEIKIHSKRLIEEYECARTINGKTHRRFKIYPTDRKMSYQDHFFYCP